MTDREQHLRLALALGPGQVGRATWPRGLGQADYERWLQRSWGQRARYGWWAQARSPDGLLIRAQTELARLAALGARASFAGEHDYPAAFTELPRCPPVVFRRGRGPTPDRRWVAVVGARAATCEGVERATELARVLAAQGFGVVSGGALGIDAAAHRGALEANGETVALLGSGMNRLYPERHQPLFERIADRGALMTAFPLDSPPRRAHFPQRNGLIAALASLVVVVEAAARSGALNTASWARELGRPVAAFARSTGCQQLLQAGAWRLRSPDDALELLETGHLSGAPNAGMSAASAEADALLALLAGGPEDADSLAARAGLKVGRALLLLTRLELEGHVRVEGGLYTSVRPDA